MAISFEDLQVLRVAEVIADAIWQAVSDWKPFERDVVGKQLASAADSIGANLAESYGRYHYGEKLQFLYFARGSLYETKYWLNRAASRRLMAQKEVQRFIDQLTALARQLNNLAVSTKNQKQKSTLPKRLRDTKTAYVTFQPASLPLISDSDLDYIQSN
jgi:four helix bundle protein